MSSKLHVLSNRMAQHGDSWMAKPSKEGSEDTLQWNVEELTSVLLNILSR